MPVNVAIALGGNATSSAGSPAATLRSALIRLSGESVKLTGVSRFFATPAYPAGSGPDFVNAAAMGETDLSPGDLLTRLHAVEAAHGRERRVRWAQRTLDLDLLWYGDRVLPDPEGFARWHDLPPDRQMAEAPDGLVLPHPRLQDRPFVLIPLVEIAPGWRHPVLGRTVAEMAAAVPEAEKQSIRPI